LVHIPTYRKKLRQENIEAIKGKMTYEDPKLIDDIHKSLGFIFPYLINQEMTDSIKWLVGWSDYCNDKNKVNSFFKYKDYSLSRGQGVQINLFGHMGTELTYDHPAIVLDESKDWIIIAPTSSTCFQDEEPLHIDLTPADGGVVNKNCGIKLENIRMVSKKRVKSIFTGKVTPEKLNEIDGVVAKYLAPSVEKELVVQNQLVASLEQEVEEKNLEILRLQNELSQVATK
jgi:mRNA-degrading endonuclease toxin of MazEF toxin-antitoxin module